MSAIKFHDNVDMQKLQINNLVIDKQSSAPSSPVEGQFYYDTTKHRLYYYNGTAWGTVPLCVLAFSVAGTISVATGAHRIYNDSGITQNILACRASVGTAPTGASLIVDVNKNGTTIFTTQANRPTIAASGNTSGKVTNMDVTTLADGDYVTVDVDQVGSTVAGSNLVIQVLAF